MPAEAYLGRVGGLAVALSLGAALLTGWNSGLAWADESAGTAGSTTSSATSGAEPEAADPDVSEKLAKPDDIATTNDAEHSAPPGVVVSTGGLTQDDEEPTTETPPSETVAPSPPDANDDDATTDEPKASKETHPASAKPTKTESAPPVSTVAATHDEPTEVASRRTTPVADQPEQTITTVTEHVSVAIPHVAPTAASSPTPVSPNVVTAMISVVSGVVNAILSPFASNSQETPAMAPSIWSLLAFARREFENAFSSPSLSDTPPLPHTTSETRTLVLTAFPAEADAVLARTTLDPNPSVVVDGRHFYLGSIGGKKVIVAMTGIGMVNATQTTETALAHFTPESGISISAVVFAGVAGGSGRTEIGSVAVPARWTSDDGATWRPVDADMLAAANALDVDLESIARLGDPLCACSLLAQLPLVDLKREPQLFVGGDGSSDDNNNGTAFPAIPFGGDVFGPQPCTAPDRSLLFPGNFFQAVVPFLTTGLLSNLTGLLNPVTPAVDAVDQETAAAQQVADAHGIPFLGIRGMSDGPGDPLNLPGYPFTFFVYKQIAAANAAIVTEAFLQNWNEA
jgi:nucleoside phosphorylase